ncbi:hypothetical protein KIPE111705_23765 [Kibdelosporangium persicum]|uniref:Signal transduction histidine kinase n=1 Tax=Kibdelosporangium persicum TaxID=2698649 RepID=A0ABX2F3D5_9PSEU|nr:hypothetical protein [Kibdelosporangium persicum]NRN65817.1 hypothetical protein [Kibdelosporangium persicum]
MTLRDRYIAALDGALAQAALLIAVVIRLSALAVVAFAVPFVWRKFSEPALALVLLAGLALCTCVVLLIWRRAGMVTRAGLAVDIPMGPAAMLANASITPYWPQGWSFFTFPYTVLLSLTLGMAVRSALGAVLAGLTWSGGYTLAVSVFHHVDPVATLGVVPGYVAYTVIGWAAVRAQRRADAEIVEARRREVTSATQLAVERERHRHVRALHDRILQTLEALAYSDLITDQNQREVVRSRAAWLRRLVETEATPVGNDLHRVAEEARAAGLSVDLHDRRLRAERPNEKNLAVLAGAARTLLLSLADHNQAVVVRADIDDAKVLLTILVTRGTTPPDAESVVRARETLIAAGGGLLLEPDPYAELWVPA